MRGLEGLVEMELAKEGTVGRTENSAVSRVLFCICNIKFLPEIYN